MSTSFRKHSNSTGSKVTYLHRSCTFKIFSVQKMSEKGLFKNLSANVFCFEGISIRELSEILLVMLLFQYSSCFVALIGCSRIFDTKNKTIAHKICITRKIGAVNNFDTTFFDNSIILHFLAFDKTIVIIILGHLAHVNCQV